jgi:hypothetical protein
MSPLVKEGIMALVKRKKSGKLISIVGNRTAATVILMATILSGATFATAPPVVASDTLDAPASATAQSMRNLGEQAHWIMTRT